MEGSRRLVLWLLYDGTESTCEYVAITVTCHSFTCGGCTTAAACAAAEPYERLVEEDEPGEEEDDEEGPNVPRHTGG